VSTRQRPRGAQNDESYSDEETAWLAALGMALRLGRVRLGWSQAELAQHAGSSRVTVSYTERGYQSSLVTYRRLAEAMGMSLGEALEKAETLAATPAPTEQETQVPADSPVIGQLADAAASGTVTYLTRDGRRIAAVVPADLAEAVLPEPPVADDDDLVLSTAASRRKLQQLAREQGVQPVTDPAELRGPGVPDDEFEAVHATVMSGRSQE
jgi:transcriptional regulator with XRE-family HTH domain